MLSTVLEEFKIEFSFLEPTEDALLDQHVCDKTRYTTFHQPSFFDLVLTNTARTPKALHIEHLEKQTTMP